MLSSTVRAGLRTSLTLTANVPRAVRRHDHIRSISRCPVVNFPTNNSSLSQAKGCDPPIEADSVKPGHAVISTFDLFSIGGEYSHITPHLTTDKLSLSSRTKQLTHSRTHACWQNFHRGSKRTRFAKSGRSCPRIVAHDSI